MPSNWCLRFHSECTFSQRQNDGVKHNALGLEHMLVNRSIQTGRVASKKFYNRDAVYVTLARPVWIDPQSCMQYVPLTQIVM